MKAVYKITFLNLRENVKVEYYFYTDNVKKALAKVPTGKLIEVENICSYIMTLPKIDREIPITLFNAKYQEEGKINFNSNILANRLEDVIDYIYDSKVNAEIESIKIIQTNIEIVE